MALKGLLLFLILTGPLFSSLSHALTVNSDVNSDTTWTLADSPVEVTDTAFVVTSGTTLSINPGVTVQFAGSVTIEGKLLSVGNSVSPISFEAYDDADDIWGPFSIVRNNCAAEDVETTTLDYTNVSDLGSYMRVYQQSLSLLNSSFDVSTSSSYSFSVYNNNGSACGDDVLLTIDNIEFTGTTSYTGAGLARSYGMNIDGMNSTITSSDFDFTFTGEPYQAYGIRTDTSNTDPFDFTFHVNNLTVTANDDDTEFLTGLEEDIAITTSVAYNTITMTAHNEMTGLRLVTGGSVENTINLTSTSATSNTINTDVFGIYSEGTSSGVSLRTNTINLTSDIDRVLTGIYCQHGTVSNNRIRTNLTANSGSAYGIYHMYYPGNIINNSISLSSNQNRPLTAFYFGTRHTQSDSIVKNNLVVGNGLSNSQGFEKSENYEGTITNDYNILYNFGTNYTNVSAGSNEIYSDPRLDDASTFTLLVDSPAWDAGDWTSTYGDEPAPNGGRVNIGWYGNLTTSPTTITLVAPLITTNSGSNFSQDTSAVTLTGKTSSATQTLLVNDSATGVTYTPGETTWSYSGTLASGVNTLNIVSKNASNQSSNADSIQVTYNAAASEDDSEEDTEESQGDSSNDDEESDTENSGGSENGSSSSVAAGCSLQKSHSHP